MDALILPGSLLPPFLSVGLALVILHSTRDSLWDSFLTEIRMLHNHLEFQVPVTFWLFLHMNHHAYFRQEVGTCQQTQLYVPYIAPFYTIPCLRATTS